MSNVSNATGDDADDHTVFAAYKGAVLLWKIVPPILIILGTFGNVLSIIVLTRRNIRRSTTATYLTVLAFSDLVVLYSGLLRQWLVYLVEEDVRHVSEAGCKIHLWIVYISLDFSAWILMAVTIERVISVWFPYTSKSKCTRTTAIAFMASILTFLLVFNGHILFGFGNKIDSSGTVTKCVELTEDYDHFFNKVWPWLDLSAFCGLPFIVLVVGNALILIKVVMSQRKTKQSRVGPAPSSIGNGHLQQKNSKQSSMTAILFTLNIVFLLCTSPVSIYNVGYPGWEANADTHQLAVLDLWWAITNLLQYTNNAMNFLLYCLSGTKFREEVKRLFLSIFFHHNVSLAATASRSNYNLEQLSNVNRTRAG